VAVPAEHPARALASGPVGHAPAADDDGGHLGLGLAIAAVLAVAAVVAAVLVLSSLGIF
jgi:hypothetical protein